MKITLICLLAAIVRMILECFIELTPGEGLLTYFSVVIALILIGKESGK